MTDNKEKELRPTEFFKRNRMRSLGFIIILAILTFLSSKLIDFEFFTIFGGLGSSFMRFTQTYLPPDFSQASLLFKEMLVTFMLAVASGVIGSILAYIFGLMISRKTRFSKALATICRIISTIMRNIPASVWAMILILSFWYGDFLALVVMTISSFGFNSRVFANTFDETSLGTIEALESVGAGRMQIIGQAVTPESIPQLVSWTLYSIETNLRDSTVIGMLTGGGIGYYVDYFRQFRRFEELTTAIIMVVIAVLLFDRLTALINEELLV